MLWGWIGRRRARRASIYEVGERGAHGTIPEKSARAVAGLRFESRSPTAEVGDDPARWDRGISEAKEEKGSRPPRAAWLWAGLLGLAASEGRGQGRAGRLPLWPAGRELGTGRCWAVRVEGEVRPAREERGRLGRPRDGPRPNWAGGAAKERKEEVGWASPGRKEIG